MERGVRAAEQQTFAKLTYKARLIKAMFDAGVSWAWGRGAERVRLLVHEDNERAQGAYRKAGFRPSGVRVPFVKDAAQNELEFVLDR
ncbi:GNAT family N-acetyltransferase [Streptomyces murinus]|uniref:GNAT family N-acetyltransferase n=1 Tax=Streptomyces murinus TaxID=33900 RepID=UPI0026CAADF6